MAGLPSLLERIDVIVTLLHLLYYPTVKPGKPSDVGSSVKQISLLSPTVNILEALILPSLTEAIALKDQEYGFRKGLSTTTALHDITVYINKGINQRKPVDDRTISVAIDLSKAFDTVDHAQLLEDINELNLNSHIRRFLCAYLRGRQTFVESKSKYSKIKQGVP